MNALAGKFRTRHEFSLGHGFRREAETAAVELLGVRATKKANLLYKMMCSQDTGPISRKGVWALLEV